MKLSKKSAAVLLASLGATLLMSGCGQVKVGYVDGDRVVKEAPQIKALVDEGNRKMQDAQTEAENKLQENPNISQEDAQKIQTEAQRKMASLNQSYSMQLQNKLQEALADISKQKKLDVVVDSSVQQPVAISGCVDVTDDAIQKLQ